MVMDKEKVAKEAKEIIKTITAKQEASRTPMNARESADLKAQAAKARDRAKKK